MLGFQPKETDANFESWKESLHPDDAADVLQAFNDHIAGKAPYYEALHRMIAKNGSITWVLDRGRVSEWNAHGEPVKVIGTHIDMTKEKQYEEQLALLALHDPLTLLNNRHALQNYFCEMKAQGPLCVVFIDLDNFKHVNDTLGHRSGDEVLIQLSQRFTELSPAEVIIGRLGGDEFVLLIPWALNHPRVKKLAHACLDAVMAPLIWQTGMPSLGRLSVCLRRRIKMTLILHCSVLMKRCTASRKMASAVSLLIPLFPTPSDSAEQGICFACH